MAMIECKRFVEFGDGWFSSDPAIKTRTNLVFEPIMLIPNTLRGCVAWIFPAASSYARSTWRTGGGNWTIDETYETMKGLLMKAA